jgi:hypothetical protein
MDLPKLMQDLMLTEAVSGYEKKMARPHEFRPYRTEGVG